ncbi:FecR domain-containing protein [Novosphingobium flavum]|uniref:FecR domain-containing protein n=1 Tax=Novosphingobium flavum TaxID=1778672 RepID=A0A7X1KL88_9SPHN|nr:FecR domain-containing protein [Novosphingobium flavum]MBC2665351.1 FecR domain-containing protein [Novosphingobium flavum]
MQAAAEGEPVDAEGWDARLRSPLCSEEDRAAFARWWAEAPENAGAMENLHARISLLKGAARFDPRLRALTEKATVAAGERVRRRWKVAAAICIVGGVGVLALSTVSGLTGPVTVYRTAAGKQSTIQLEDGSEVVLNSKSELAVQYGIMTRSLTLKAGEAMFEVAHERRPFVVTVGSQEVVAVGTAFNIRTGPRDLEVTMVHGKVNVRPAVQAHGDQQVFSLVAGQRLVADHVNRSVTVTQSDAKVETAWLEGRVQFEDKPLAEAISEINRYTDHPISIADPSLQSLVVNGSFRTAQPENFVAALTSYYPIRAKITSAGDVELVRR